MVTNSGEMDEGRAMRAKDNGKVLASLITQ